MLNLLQADLKALLKWKATIYTLIIMIVLGALVPFMNIILYETSALNGVFEWTYIVMMISSIIIGLFIYRDYSQNTIRNKVVVGHSRTSIYFSKAILIALFLIGVFIIFLLSAIIVALCLGNIDYIDWSVFLQNCGVAICSSLTAASLIALLSINIQSPVGAMLPMMLLFAIMFCGMILMEMLITKEQTQVLELLQTLPITAGLTLTESTKPFNLTDTIIYSSCICFVMQMLGFKIFRKLELK